MKHSLDSHSGALYIVATPIGNKEDMSPRALAVLSDVDFILAEDTRHSSQLLSMFGVKKPLSSFHAHNESKKSESIIAKLLGGASCALLSDAGTPLISDPGFPLVQLAHANNIPVIPIPGPCALITALSGAGVACDKFTFCGFLPAKKTARLRELQTCSTWSHTLVWYESTHRIIESLDDIASVFGEDCELVVAKELTKAFERFIRGRVGEVKAWLLLDSNHCKGEFVVILPKRKEEKETISHHLLSVLLAELPLKQAVSIASKITELPKNELYNEALLLQKNRKD